MEYVLAVAVCAVVAGYLIFRKKNRTPPQDTYVCDVCGEAECLCHKVEKK